MIKHKERTWYGFDHATVKKQFSGNPEFIREFQIGGHTWAVYFCDAPDLSKGHKPYMMLGRFTEWLSGDHGVTSYRVSGREVSEMETLRYQTGILCKACDTVLYSMNHHDFTTCGCRNETSIDGGSSYTRTLAADFSQTAMVTIDLLTDETFDSETGEIYIPRPAVCPVVRKRKECK